MTESKAGKAGVASKASVKLNELEKSVEISPAHASSEDSTVDQGFSSDKPADKSAEKLKD